MGVLSENLTCAVCGEHCQHVLFEADDHVTAWCSHCCSEWSAPESDVPAYAEAA